MFLKLGKLAGVASLALIAMPGCAGAPVATASASAPAASMPAQGRPNFSGVWILTTADRVVMPETNGELTPEAKANLDHFKKYYEGDNADPAIKVCLLKGMPWTSLIRARDYPVEIDQRDDRIYMMFELYDQYRAIRIGGAPKPDTYPDSPNGYSVAHWEGDTLVIETSGLMPLNPIGPNLRGMNAKVTERWSLKQDPEYGEVLVVDLEQDDPDVYVKPAKGHNEMRRAPEGTVVGGYGCSISLWDGFVEKMEEEIASRSTASK